MKTFRLCGALLLVALCAQTGCFYRGAAKDVDLSQYAAESGWTVLQGVPFVRQHDPEACGAAAVAAVRAYWGERGVDEARVRAESKTEVRKPLRAGTLRDVMQQHGYDAFVVKSELQQLASELAQGRPIIVGTAKPYAADNILSHYQVVIGMHEQRGILTMDPSEGYRHYPTDGFLLEWKPTQQLAIVSAPRQE